MRLTHRQLEAFRAVMVAGTMTGAAELLRVTQPAVTRLIRDLEAETGLALFERRGNMISATRAAVALSAEVERSFIGLAAIAEFADGLRGEMSGSLRIAAIPTLADGLLARFLVPFMRAHRGIQVSLVSMTSHLVVEAVASGSADIGYMGAPLDRVGFQVDPTPMAAVVVLPEGHRLADRPSITPEDLAGEAVTTLRPGSLFAARVDVALAGIPRLTTFTARTSHGVCTLVAAGAGPAIVDPMAVVDFVGRGLVVRPFSVFIETGFQAIRRREEPDSRLLAALVEGFDTFVRMARLPGQDSWGRRLRRSGGLGD